jgi:hypothetical protein
LAKQDYSEDIDMRPEWRNGCLAVSLASALAGRWAVRKRGGWQRIQPKAISGGRRSEMKGGAGVSKHLWGGAETIKTSEEMKRNENFGYQDGRRRDVLSSIGDGWMRSRVIDWKSFSSSSYLDLMELMRAFATILKASGGGEVCSNCCNAVFIIILRYKHVSNIEQSRKIIDSEQINSYLELIQL